MPVVSATSQNIARAAALLKAGELVAFPTETVYGVGANALDEAAVARIFAAKGRPAFNPLIVHVASTSDAKNLVKNWPKTAEFLAQTFWPGPLTLVLPKTAQIPSNVSAGGETVALRVPAHPVALELLKAAQIPLAAPSANRSTEISPTLARHVEKSLGDKIALILDGGACEIGIESTVLDLSGLTPTILRPGAVSQGQIEALIGPVALAGNATDGAARPSPGMMERHYAPRATLKIFQTFAEIEPFATQSRTGWLVREGFRVQGPVWTLPDDPAGFARDFYAALHDLDDAGCEVIWAQNVPETADWNGVRDRLKRAAG